jgi:Sulfite exporter TauE/SafE
MSLIVVITALPVRLTAVPYDELSPHWHVVVNLLAGSLLGAWMGASAATRMRSVTHYRVLAALLGLIAVVLVGTHLGTVDDLGLEGPVRVVTGVLAGFLIGLAASVMGVAGGELLIPTIVLPTRSRLTRPCGQLARRRRRELWTGCAAVGDARQTASSRRREGPRTRAFMCSAGFGRRRFVLSLYPRAGSSSRSRRRRLARRAADPPRPRCGSGGQPRCVPR